MDVLAWGLKWPLDELTGIFDPEGGLVLGWRMKDAAGSFEANGEELRLRGCGMKVEGERLGGVTAEGESLVAGNLKELILIGVAGLGEERVFAFVSRGIEEGEEAISCMRSRERVKLLECSSSIGSKTSSSWTSTGPL